MEAAADAERVDKALETVQDAEIVDETWEGDADAERIDKAVETVEDAEIVDKT